MLRFPLSAPTPASFPSSGSLFSSSCSSAFNLSPSSASSSSSYSYASSAFSAFSPSSIYLIFPFLPPHPFSCLPPPPSSFPSSISLLLPTLRVALARSLSPILTTIRLWRPYPRTLSPCIHSAQVQTTETVAPPGRTICTLFGVRGRCQRRAATAVCAGRGAA